MRHCYGCSVLLDTDYRQLLSHVGFPTGFLFRSREGGGRMKNVELTVEQTAAGQLLWRAVRAAMDDKLVVPCTVDPRMWDEVATPAACYGCPVLALCVRYRQTGAISHATVLGGHRVRPGSVPRGSA